MGEKHPESKTVKRLVKHASRSLLKKGHAGAMKLHGFGVDGAKDSIAFTWKKAPAKTLQFGGELSFAFEIKNTAKKPQRVMADYAVYFKKANGSLAPKVFKAAEKTLKPGEVWTLALKHKIVPITTRKYYPGEQQIEPRINGKSFAPKSFKLGTFK